MTLPSNPSGVISSDVNNSNLIEYITGWEEGTLSKEDALKLFQFLVDTGMAWQLQGSYGRQARRLIDAGLIKE